MGKDYKTMRFSNTVPYLLFSDKQIQIFNARIVVDEGILDMVAKTIVGFKFVFNIRK